MLDISDVLGFWVLGLNFIIFYPSVTMYKSEKVHWDFEKFIGFNGMKVKIKFDFFSGFFNVEAVLFFVKLVFFSDSFCDFFEVFFVELLKFGSEYFGENLIDFNKMSELNHAIGLIEN